MFEHQLLAPNTCLVNALKERLCEQQGWHRAVVVLPTQRLATAVLASVAAEVGASWTPVFLTWEQFIQLYADAGPQQISDELAEILLWECLQSTLLKHLQPAHAREIRLLLNEYEKSALAAEAWQQLEEKLLADIHRSERHIGSLIERLHEIAGIAQTFYQQLAERGWETSGQRLRRQAQALALQWHGSAPLPFDTLILAGITSLQPCELEFMATLAAHPNCQVFMYQAPADLEHSPLGQLNKRLLSIGAWSQPRKVTLTAHDQGIQLIEADDIWHECATALQLVQQATARGICARQIAILLPDETNYGTVLRTLLHRQTLTCNFAVPQSFFDSRLGQWLQLLLLMLSGEAERVESAAFWLHGYTLTWLQRRAGLLIGDDERALIQTWQYEWEKVVDENNWPPALLEARFSLESYVREQQSLWQGARFWNAWLLLLQQQLSFFVVDAESDREHAAAWECLTTQLNTWMEAPFTPSTPMVCRDFVRLWSDFMGRNDLRPIGEPLAGLQILSLSEARAMPFEYVVLLGCMEGVFPKALPRDDLLNDYLKQTLGLPGWAALESMEDVTFSLLAARIPQLVLLRSRRWEEQETIVSRFVGRLQRQGLVQTYAAPVTESEDSPVVVRAGAEGHVGDYARPLTRWSATRLAQFMGCPYQFLLNDLRFNACEPLQETPDKRDEGTWLHEVLEVFFSQDSDSYIVPAWPKRFTTEMEWRDYALRRLMALSEAIVPRKADNEPLMRQLLAHSWPSFIGHVWRMYNGIVDPKVLWRGKREAQFGHKAHHTIQLHDRAQRATGFIDAVDITDNLIVVTDYKRSYIPQISGQQLYLHPQLLFYALNLKAILPAHTYEEAVFGYYNILNGQWKAVAVGRDVRDIAIERQLCTKKTHTVQELLGGLKEAYQWREQDITAEQRFYADPSHPDLCSRCDVRDMCRIDDPHWRAQLWEQQRWQQQFVSVGGDEAES